ncbi:transposase [Rhodococcus sp. C26F]
MSELWVGVDAGKRAHHCGAIDAAGAVVLSKRIDNDESALLDLISAVLVRADGDAVVWGTDLNTGGPALLLALLGGVFTMTGPRPRCGSVCPRRCLEQQACPPAAA